jgi:hypothetical protein
VGLKLNGTHQLLVYVDDVNTLLFHHRNFGKNCDIKIADRFFENMARLTKLGTTVTNKNFIQKEIKERLNSGNACYH